MLPSIKQSLCWHFERGRIRKWSSYQARDPEDAALGKFRNYRQLSSANSSRQYLDAMLKEKPVDPWLRIWQCATPPSVVCALLLGAAMYHPDTPGDPMMGRYKRIVTHMGIFCLIGSWFCLLVGVGVWSFYSDYPWILMLAMMACGVCISA